MKLLIFAFLTLFNCTLAGVSYTGEATFGEITGPEILSLIPTPDQKSNVGGIICYTTGGKTYILLASESSGKSVNDGGQDDKGKFSDLGGKGKQGESLQQTLLRKILEESGRQIQLTEEDIRTNAVIFYAAMLLGPLYHIAYAFIHTKTFYDPGAMKTGSVKKGEFYWVLISSLLQADKELLKKEKKRIEKEAENKEKPNVIEVEVLNEKEKKKITLGYWFLVQMLNDTFREALEKQAVELHHSKQSNVNLINGKPEVGTKS